LTEPARTDTLKCDEVSEQSRVVTVPRNKGTGDPAEIFTWLQQAKRTFTGRVLHSSLPLRDPSG